MIDEKDCKILELLSKNSRASYTEIGRILGMSDVAVMKRIKKLEESGIIKRFTIVIDPRKIGYNAVSITGIDVEPEYLFEVIRYLKDKDYVKSLILATGDHNIIAIIWARNGNELSEIHREISKIPGVKRLCPAIILDIIKDLF